MNWLEIDKMLIGMLERHDDIEDVYAESEKQFKWNRSQAKSAIDPLVERHPLLFKSNTIKNDLVKPTKKRSKQSTKRK